MLCQHLPKWNFSLSLVLRTAFLRKEKSIHNEVFNNVGVANESHVKAFEKDRSYLNFVTVISQVFSVVTATEVSSSWLDLHQFPWCLLLSDATHGKACVTTTKEKSVLHL